MLSYIDGQTDKEQALTRTKWIATSLFVLGALRVRPQSPPMKEAPAQPSTTLSRGGYVEKLTFLLFLKMTAEQSRPPFKKPSPIPKGFGWDVLIKLDGDDLETHSRHTLEEPGTMNIPAFLRSNNDLFRSCSTHATARA